METSSSLPANPSSTNSGGHITGTMETDALVRVSTFPLPATASNKKRRRRFGKRTATFAGPPRRQQSFSRDIGHAAAETYLVTRLTIKLLRYLGVGYRWMTRLLALALYAMLLMPGFLRGKFQIILSYIKYRKFEELLFIHPDAGCSVGMARTPEWLFILLLLLLLLLSKYNDHVQAICHIHCYIAEECLSLVGFCYFFSSQVRRSIVYRDKPRNRLDLYLPSAAYGGDLKPVVIFVTGGAWIIGYKAWGSLLGLQLAERGIMVACIDYRNFPQGTISDMVDDVSQGIAFVLDNIIELGGDPNKIYLMGQSAGAHISACALVHQAVREFKEENICWSASQISAYFGLSGGYNLLKLVDHFHGRGLYRSIFLSIMEGEKALEQFSPEMIVRNLGSSGAASQLPRIILFHGTEDYSIPCEASKNFVEALRNAGVQADLILYDGKTHTDLFLQDPLRGGKDDLFDYLVAFIHADDNEALAMDATAPPRKRLVPELLLRLAGHISPF